VARDVGGPADLAPLEQGRTHDQGVEIVEDMGRPMLGPGIGRRCAAAHRDIEAAAQLLMPRRDRRDRDLDHRMRLVKALEARDQPAAGKRRRCAHAQDAPGSGLAAGLGRCRQPIERQADLGREDARDRRRHPAAPRAREQPLAEPAFQYRDLPADRPMRQAKLGSRLDIAVGTRGDFEDAKRIEWWKAAHCLCEES
jgi:hypothetical protein